jgi:hypothetical protein
MDPFHDQAVKTEFLVAFDSGSGNTRHGPSRRSFLPAGSGIVDF